MIEIELKVLKMNDLYRIKNEGMCVEWKFCWCQIIL